MFYEPPINRGFQFDAGTVVHDLLQSSLGL
jgi:hypothetical protein